MSLTKEWNNRISNWLKELQHHFYQVGGVINLEGFTTFDRLTLDVAATRVFHSMPVGSVWGAKWEYGWFRGQLTLPPAAAGRRVAIRLNPGLEGIVFINGKAAGARDREHQEITLSHQAAGGETYDILAEFYAGHGPIEENIGPVPPGHLPLPEPGPHQRTVEASTWGFWDDDAFKLWIDAETLFQTRSVLPETSLRVAEIDKALKEFTRIVDFEQPPPDMRESFRSARLSLRPQLNCVNGSTAPTMYIFGNSHLDLAWQWPKEETVRKSARTMSTQLALMDEYPEYRFFWCQVPLFEMLRDFYPEVWQRTKERIRDGSIMVEGGMWLEPDTNLPSGESLIRQVMWAKEFFKDELGQDTRLLWLPDTFGFSAALPQIMKGTGLDYFATKKLIDNYNDCDPFPLTTFRWQGLDGSEVLAHIYRKCNSPIDPKTLAKRWNVDRIQKDNISAYLFPFGYGDGGGGPTRTMIEFTRRLENLEGNPRTRWSHPRSFFEDLEKGSPIDEYYRGELYFQEHRGTYTSQAATKRANRKTEIALRDTELWTAFAGILTALPWPRDALRGIWRTVLFNHFHDIISGASINRVYKEALAELEKARSESERLTAIALHSLGETLRPESLVDDETVGLTVFNSLSWNRKTLYRLPAGISALTDSRGNPVPVQESPSGTWAEIQLPSCGWAGFSRTVAEVFAPAQILDPVATVTVQSEGGSFILENGHLRVQVAPDGRIPSIVDKATGLELASDPCNDFRMYKDVTTNYDAWDIDSMYTSLPVTIADPDTRLTLEADGPLFASLRLERRLASSTLSQEIRLAADSCRIEFHTVIEWREDHKLLKVDFPTTLHADDALYEIQFGHVRRPTHRNRRYDADRYEGCQHKWNALCETNRGVALLNDCKYGSNVTDGTLSLTLLKSPWVPDTKADRGHHEFSYAFLAWSGDFALNGPVREGYDFNIPPQVASSRMEDRSLITIDSASVVLETIKRAEDGGGDLILRLYEASGSAVRTTIGIDFDFLAVFNTDMLEQNGTPCSVVDKQLSLDFRAFEIKTIRIVF